MPVGVRSGWSVAATGSLLALLNHFAAHRRLVVLVFRAVLLDFQLILRAGASEFARFPGSEPAASAAAADHQPGSGIRRRVPVPAKPRLAAQFSLAELMARVVFGFLASDRKA